MVSIPETYRTLSGEPDILEEKIRALDRLAEIGLNVTLVPAIERGVNEHEIGQDHRLCDQASRRSRDQLPAGISCRTPCATRPDEPDDHS